MEKNIQDQLDRVAKQAEGTSEEPKEETLEEETTEDPVKADEPKDDEVDSKPKEDDEETDDSKDDERKQASAFAAMRKRLKELEEENKTLKGQKKEEPKKEEPKEESDSSKTQTELEKRLAEAEKYIQEMRQKEQQQRITNEVVELKERYGLDNDALVEFADELEKRGFQIGNTSMSLTDMYAAVNHEKIVQAEVEKAKKEIAAQSNDTPPSTGPKPNAGTSSKQKDDVRSTIARVASKIS